jgi:hypothetical protein
MHPVLNGYLSGQAIGDNDAGTSLLAQPDWDGKNLSLRYLAARGDASAVADILLKIGYPAPLTGLCCCTLAARCAQGSLVARKSFRALLTILQAEGQPAPPCAARPWQHLLQAGDPGAATLFRQLLGSRSFDLLPLAALGSGAMRDAKAVDALEEIMQAPAGSVRRATCLALVAIGTEKSLEAVARALLQGDEELRRAAAEAWQTIPAKDMPC